MNLVALTGGIASGKSTIANRWAERGAVIVDADQIARDVVAPGSPVLDDIVTRFGNTVLAVDGSLDRGALGAIVFEDSEAREDLNAITHPAIARLAASRIAQAQEEDPNKIVVYDIPLLVESAHDTDRYARIVTVEAGTDVQVARLVDIRGYERQEAISRVESQATAAQRRAIADVVIDSSGKLADTVAQADEVWDGLQQYLR